MSKIKEAAKPSNQTNSTKGRTFNEWIDHVYGHVERMNRERYGINTSSTVKT